jgi:hypothetical protein
MEPLGINMGLGLLELIPMMLLIGLPIISLIDLARKRLSGTPLAIWVLIICAIPWLGSIAYWIVRPTAEGTA